MNHVLWATAGVITSAWGFVALYYHHEKQSGYLNNFYPAFIGTAIGTALWIIGFLVHLL